MMQLIEFNIKKIVLMLLLTFMSSSAIADWTQFANNRDKSMIVYVKLPKSIEPQYKVKMWVLFDYGSKQKFSNFEFKSIVNQIVFDCKNELTSILYSAYYSKNMSEGNAVAINQNATQWIPNSPNSITEGLWKYSCGMD